MKWSNETVLEVIEEARLAGAKEAAAQLELLRKNGPKYEVVSESGKAIDTMLDVCGFAYLKISARGKFYSIAKKLSAGNKQRFICCHSYNGGGYLNIFDCTHRQELSVNRAAMRGASRILEKYGITSSVVSRID